MCIRDSCCAAATGGNILVKDLCADHIASILPLMEEMGCKLDVTQDSVAIRAPKRLKALKDCLLYTSIKSGDVFVCINGAVADGHEYADAALQKGACAVVCERDLGLKEQILVPDTHLAYSKMAANYYGNPSKKLRLIGVTGTNGKTTTTKLVKSVLTGIGKKVGLIGSIQNEIGDEVIHAEQTTPDAMELEGLYARMVEAGCEFCVMEVSSHALDQRRIGDSHYRCV